MTNEEWIEAQLANAPPLTGEQVFHLRAIFTNVRRRLIVQQQAGSDEDSEVT